MEFEIQSMSLGMLGTNCYLGIRKDTLDTLIFHPGAEGDRLIRYIERGGASSGGYFAYPWPL